MFDFCDIDFVLFAYQAMIICWTTV